MRMLAYDYDYDKSCPNFEDFSLQMMRTIITCNSYSVIFPSKPMREAQVASSGVSVIRLLHVSWR